MKHLANDWLAGEKEKEGRRKEKGDVLLGRGGKYIIGVYHITVREIL